MDNSESTDQLVAQIRIFFYILGIVFFVVFSLAVTRAVMVRSATMKPSQNMQPELNTLLNLHKNLGN